MKSSHILKINRDEFRCRNTSPELLICPILSFVTKIKTLKWPILWKWETPSRVICTRAQEDIWHVVSLAHIFSFLCSAQRDPIGRHVSPWQIWLVDCPRISLAYKVRLTSPVSKTQTKIIFRASCIGHPGSRQIFIRFWSGNRQCLQQCLLQQIRT